jgi:hypothetical protein
MNTPSFRDVEQLSAYLDGQLSQAERSRLESRLGSNPALAAILEDLSRTRAVLRKMPRRRVPRNFTLTPKMAGLRPPVPRSVPALSWASAVAMLLFVCSLGTGLLGRFSFGAAAPMMAAAPAGMGGGGNANDSGTEAYGIGGGPPAGTEVPAELTTLSQPTSTPDGFTSQTLLPTATAEITNFQAPGPTPAPDERIAVDRSTSPKNPTWPVSPWLLAWFGLAVALIGTALAIRWAAVRRFRKRLGTQK